MMRTMYYGGDIVTMRAGECPEAVVTEGDRIVFVGALANARARGQAQEIDLRGQTLLPAFLDAHGHLMMTAQYRAYAPLGECADFDEIADALASHLARHPLDAGQVLIGYDYDHTLLKEQAHPTRALLDRVSETVPICILNASGHMCVANSAMLQLSGLSRESVAPAGGYYGRDEYGELSGYLEEVPAMLATLTKAFAKAPCDLPAQLADVQREYLQNGVSTVQEGAAALDGFRSLAALAEAGTLSLDVVAYVMSEDYAAAVAQYPALCAGYTQHLRIGGAKTVLDGSPQGRSAWLSTPYVGGDEAGYPAHTDDEVRAAVRAAVEGGYQLLFHCNGDAASEQALDAFAAVCTTDALRARCAATRPVMIHCQTVRDDQLDRMAAFGMLPSFFPAHVRRWGEVHRRNLGEARAARISPIASAVARGLPFTLHQDTPVCPPKPLQAVACAVERRTAADVLLGEAQQLDAFTALKGITLNAAFGYHEEAEKGTIEVGKRADLTVLSHNPLTFSAAPLDTIAVCRTVIAGETAYCREE